MNPKEFTPRQARLTAAQVDYCLLHMIRVPELFEQAKDELAPENFDRNSELPCLLLWGAALTAANNNGGKLPEEGTRKVLELELSVYLSKLGPIPDETLPQTIKFLDWVYATKPEDLSPVYYRNYVRDLIIERRIIATVSRDIAQARDIGRPVDLPKRLQDYATELQSVMSDPAVAAKSAFPIDTKPKPLNLFGTGMEWLNKFLNGGQAGGEVYGVLGPTGVGKTSLAVMLTVGAARLWAKEYTNKKCAKKRVTFLVSWEQDSFSLAKRIWANAARVSSRSIDDWLRDYDPVPLSTTGKLKPYEYVELKDMIDSGGVDRCPGEHERLQAARAELDDYIKIVDFSGYDPEISTAGINCVSDVIPVMNATLAGQRDAGIVILDYAGVAIRRMLALKNKTELMRHYLANWGDECRYRIAHPFDCPVWAFNQMNAEGNRKSPTAEQSHTDASECAAFVENMWFAFVFGTKDRENNVAYMWRTKERRARGTAKPVLLDIQGDFCRLVDAGDAFQPDNHSRRLVPKKVAEAYIAPAERREYKEVIDPSRVDW